MDTSFPAITVRQDGLIKTAVYVRSSLKDDVSVVPTLFLRQASGVAMEPIPLSAIPIPKLSVGFGLPIVFKLRCVREISFPLSGWLSLTPLSPSPSTVKPLEIREVAGPGTGADWSLLERALLLAAAGTLLAGFAVTQWGRRGGALLHRMGKPTWSGVGSWISNLTIAGAIVGNLVLFSGLPDHGDMLGKKAYAIVSLMLAALVGLAPGVYGLFSRAVQTKDDRGMSVVQVQGYVCLFLVTAFLTIVGAIAQLGLMDLLFSDVAATGTLSPATAECWHYFLVILQIALWMHAVVAMIRTVEAQSVTKADAEGTQPDKISPSGTQLDAAIVPNVKRQLPDWSLL